MIIIKYIIIIIINTQPSWPPKPYRLSLRDSANHASDSDFVHGSGDASVHLTCSSCSRVQSTAYMPPLPLTAELTTDLVCPDKGE